MLGPGDEFLGIVTREKLIEAMRESGPQTPVSEFMIRDVEEVTEHEELETVMEKIATSPTRIVAVRGPSHRFLGYVSAENAAELFMLRQARKAGTSG